MTRKKNTWFAKIKRTVTSVFPVAKNRAGKCNNCGECCKLPNKCPFLKYREDRSSYCSVHSVRPLNCRKYPRSEKEHITSNFCGYKFE